MTNPSKVSDPATDSYERLSELQRALHSEADSNPGLLTAFDVTYPPPQPEKLPRRILSTSADYQPAISIAPEQTQRKRRRGGKATAPEDGAISKAKKPKFDPMLPT